MEKNEGGQLVRALGLKESISMTIGTVVGVGLFTCGSSFVCLAASIEKEHRRPACAPSQPCLYSAFENSTPLFFFSRICAIRSAICAAASTGGTPCLLIFDTTVYSDSSMSGLAW